MLKVKDKKKEIIKTFIAWCLIYSAATIVSSAWQLISGQATDTNVHILFRGLITFIPLIFIQALRLFQCKNIVVSVIVHYCITMALVFAGVWCIGFFGELSKHAYRDIFLNYTGVYIIVAAIIIVRGTVTQRELRK